MRQSDLVRPFAKGGSLDSWWQTKPPRMAAVPHHTPGSRGILVGSTLAPRGIQELLPRMDAGEPGVRKIVGDVAVLAGVSFSELGSDRVEIHFRDTLSTFPRHCSIRPLPRLPSLPHR